MRLMDGFCCCFSDIENMFIKEAEFGIHFVSVFYGHRVVLPCAVSDPAFNVTLFTLSYQDFTNRDGVTFDPIQGFIVASPYFVFSGTFNCFAHANGTDGEIVTEKKTLALKYFGQYSQVFLTNKIYLELREVLTVWFLKEGVYTHDLH